MTRSPPPKRSPLLSSPERGLLSTFLFDDRNNELSHRDALAAAQVEHQRVREAAIRVYELHELKEEHQRILIEGQKQQERLRAEAQIVAEEQRLQELKAKTVPRPAPKPEPLPSPKRTEEQPVAKDATPKPQEARKAEPSTTPESAVKSPSAAPTAPQQNGIVPSQNKPATSNPFAASVPTQPSSQPSAVEKRNPFASPQSAIPPKPKPTAPSQPQAASQPPRPTGPTALDRYVQIHQELKKLRRDLQAESKVPGSPLKGNMGTCRREIRVSIGQLTTGKGVNAKPINKITSVLKDALEGRIQSPPIDVSKFVLKPRQPVDGVPNNDATLPSLFIYLMNICAKGIISQFINECGANPKAADPIGVFAAHIFSHVDFQWRGQSLIDIVMAKYRIVCPVLFGLRGSDKTERGRLALGWKKDGPAYITEQSHNDRMSGLGAGFASLSLRDFSKSSKTNPYPPTNYWKALAGIVNTPRGETSNTQYIVLRSMIEGHEQRFLNFYGNAAIAALRLALIEFPKRAPQDAAAAGSLSALAELLRIEDGLVLA